ncbi:MAG: serine/threonine-protein kinase [Bryobacteraceae bacterium]|nr:serine/threonine-protein kinase [Bryobacteraceae bacterium]
MTPDQRARAKELFGKALERPPAERAAFVAGSGAEEAVRAEVLSLLSQHGGEPDAETLPPTESVTEVPEGTLLAGQYRVLRKLGDGGFGVAYLAEDQKTFGQKVVVKILLQRASETAAWAAKKFEEEAAALAKIGHPGVVGLMRVGTLELERVAYPFLVMPYAEGEPLDVLMKGGPLDFATTASIVRQLGGALEAAHAKRIVHRDIKPSNVLLRRLGDGEWHVQLIDFGIAGVIPEGEYEAVTQHVAGTESYMAPEQFWGKSSTASDLYSLAVLAYRMLTGAAPFVGRDMTLRRQWKRARAVRPEIPEAVDELLAAGMRFEAEERPREVGKYARELAAALAGGGREAPVPVPGPRRRWGVAVGLAVIGLAAAAGWVLPWERGRMAGASPAMASRMVRVRVLERGTENWLSGQRVTLQEGAGFRLEVASREAGRVFVFAEEGGTGAMNVLFPSVTSYGGSSAAEAGRALMIPEKDWFEPERGTNRVWVAWVRDGEAVLEKAGRLANARDLGVVSAREEREAILRVLKGLESATVVGGEGAVELTGKGSGVAGWVEVVTK